MAKMPTAQGTKVIVEDWHDEVRVYIDNEASPDDLRHLHIGRIIGGYFQPLPHQPAYALSPNILRDIADIAEGYRRATH